MKLAGGGASGADATCRRNANENPRAPDMNAILRATRFTVAALAAAVGVGWFGAAAAADAVRWRTDLASAAQEAQQTNRLILVHFGATWCGPCVKMEREVFVDPAVGSALEASFVPVKLDADENQELVKEWKVPAFPADYILSPDGRLIAQRKGGRTTAQYIAMLQEISGKAASANLAAAPAPEPSYNAPAGGAGYGQLAQDARNAAAGGRKTLDQLQQEALAAGRTAGTFASDARGQVAAATAAYNPNAVAAQPVASAKEVFQQVKNDGTAVGASGGQFKNEAMEVYRNPLAAGDKLNQLGQTGQQLGQNTSNLANSAAQIPAVAGQAFQGVGSAFQNVQGQAGQLWNSGREQAGAAAGQLSQQGQGAIGAVQNGYNQAQTQAAAALEQGRTAVAGAAAGAQNQVQAATAGAQNAFAGAQDRFAGAQNQAAAAAEQAKTQVAAAKSDFYNAFSGAAGQAQNTVGQARNNVAATAQNWQNQASGGVQNAVNAAKNAVAAAPPSFPPVALDGFCPVTIASKKQWTVGDRRWGAWHHSRLYLFAGEAEQKLFLADPNKFAPASNGSDPVAAAEEGKDVVGRVQFACLYGDRVYLFSGEPNLAKFQQSPEKYTAEIVQAARPAR